MQLASTLAAAEYREFLPFEGMTPAHNAHGWRKVFEMGSVSGLPSTRSVMSGWSDSLSTASATSA